MKLHEEAREQFDTWQFLPPWDTLVQAFIAGYMSGVWRERKARSGEYWYAIPTTVTATSALIYLSEQGSEVTA